MIYNLNPYLGDNPFIVWDNAIARGTLAATSAAAGMPVSGLQNGVTTDPWRPASMPATVTLTLPVSEFVGAVCFAAHDMASRAVTVIVERLIGSTWTHVLTFAPQDDDPLILSFPPVSAAQWRVRFTGDNTFRLAVLSFAEGLSVPGRIIPPHVPLHRASEIDLVGDTESGTGEFLQADFERTGGRADVRFSAQMREFATSDAFELFRQHFNRGKPFFMACFPTFDFLDTGYLWRAKGAQSILTPYQDAVFMTIGMECALYVK